MFPWTKHCESMAEHSLTPVKRQEYDVQYENVYRLHKKQDMQAAMIASKEVEIERLEKQLSDLREKIDKTKQVEHVLESDGRASREQTVALSRMKRKCENKHHYLLVLRHLYERTQREQSKSATSIEGKKSELKELEKELASHSLKLRDVQNAERLAEMELEKAKALIEREEEEWQDRLEARKFTMRETKEVLDFREEQAAVRKAIIAEVQGDLDSEGERNLKRNVVTNKLKQLRLANDIAKRSEKIEEYDNAFKRIVEATGINSMEQIVDKFLSQEDTKSNLTAMIEEADAKIANLTEEKELYKKQAEEMKFSGLPQTSKQRQMLDDLELEIESMTKKNRQLVERRQFLRDVLQGIRGAIAHICDQLDQAQVPALALTTVETVDAGSAEVPATGDSIESSEVENGKGRKHGSISELNKFLRKVSSKGSMPKMKLACAKPVVDDPALFAEILKACEKRILKVVDSLPQKNIRIDDLDEKKLNKIGQGRVVVDRFRDKVQAAKPTQNLTKRGMKKIIRMEKRATKKEHRKVEKPAVTVNKLEGRKKAMIGQIEKLKAECHETSIRAHASERHAQAVKQRGEVNPDVIVAAENAADIARTEAARSSKALANAKADLEEIEKTIAKLSSKIGGVTGVDEPVVLSNSDSDSFDDDDEAEDSAREDFGFSFTGEDDFEKSIPVVGDQAGRELIKAENKRILKFAEKKRRRMSIGAEEQAKVLTEEEILESIKQETKKVSSIRPAHFSRLSFAKALKEKKEQARKQDQSQDNQIHE